MVATSSNHSEIIAIHEVSRECIWLRSMIHHIQESCGLSSVKDKLTILFEDNAACIAQIKGGYSKEIEPNTFHQNFSIHMSFRIMVKLMSSKYDQVIV